MDLDSLIADDHRNSGRMDAKHERDVESVLLVIAAFFRQVQRPYLARTRRIVDGDFLQRLGRGGTGQH